jgi:hypothetical protein
MFIAYRDKKVVGVFVPFFVRLQQHYRRPDEGLVEERKAIQVTSSM